MCTFCYLKRVLSSYNIDDDNWQLLLLLKKSSNFLSYKDKINFIDI